MSGLYIPPDSLYHISLDQWIDKLLKEKSYNDTMRWILLRWKSIYEYMYHDGKVTEDNFIIPTEALIARFISRGRVSVVRALQSLHDAECIYKKPGTMVLLSDGKPSRLIFLKAYDDMWYGKFKPIEKTQWGGDRTVPSCEKCGGKMVHVTLEHDLCKECSHMQNEIVRLHEYESE